MSKPTIITDEYGQITIESPILGLKIDKNRDILVKRVYNNEDSFTALKQRLPTGLNREQKKVYLFDLHQQLEARIIANGLHKKQKSDDDEDQEFHESEDDDDQNTQSTQKDE